MDLEKCHTLSPTRGNRKELLYPHHSTNWNHFVGSMASLTIFSESTSEVNGLSHQSSDIRFRIWMLRYVEKIRIWQKQYPKHIPTDSVPIVSRIYDSTKSTQFQPKIFLGPSHIFIPQRAVICSEIPLCRLQKTAKFGWGRGTALVMTWDRKYGSRNTPLLPLFRIDTQSHHIKSSVHSFSVGVPANLYQQNPFIKSGMPRLLRELFVQMTQSFWRSYDTAIVLWNSRVKPETPTKFKILDKSPEKSPTKKQWSDKKHQRIHLQFHPGPPIPSGRQWAKAEVCSKKDTHKQWCSTSMRLETPSPKRFKTTKQPQCLETPSTKRRGATVAQFAGGPTLLPLGMSTRLFIYICIHMYIYTWKWYVILQDQKYAYGHHMFQIPRLGPNLGRPQRLVRRASRLWVAVAFHLSIALHPRKMTQIGTISALQLTSFSLLNFPGTGFFMLGGRKNTCAKSVTNRSQSGTIGQCTYWDPDNAPLGNKIMFYSK